MVRFSFYYFNGDDICGGNDVDDNDNGGVVPMTIVMPIAPILRMTLLIMVDMMMSVIVLTITMTLILIRIMLKCSHFLLFSQMFLSFLFSYHR